MRALAILLLATACGGAPDKPMLANAPRPNSAAVAGGAAAAAAAITLASPDTATVKPEKNQNEEKKPIKVKENVPKDVLDRLDKTQPAPDSTTKTDKPAANKQPAGAQQAQKPPKDALDFSEP